MGKIVRRKGNPHLQKRLINRHPQNHPRWQRRTHQFQQLKNYFLVAWYWWSQQEKPWKRSTTPPIGRIKKQIIPRAWSSQSQIHLTQKWYRNTLTYFWTEKVIRQGQVWRVSRSLQRSLTKEPRKITYNDLTNQRLTYQKPPSHPRQLQPQPQNPITSTWNDTLELINLHAQKLNWKPSICLQSHRVRNEKTNLSLCLTVQRFQRTNSITQYRKLNPHELNFQHEIVNHRNTKKSWTRHHGSQAVIWTSLGSQNQNVRRRTRLLQKTKISRRLKPCKYEKRVRTTVINFIWKRSPRTRLSSQIHARTTRYEKQSLSRTQRRVWALETKLLGSETQSRNCWRRKRTLYATSPRWTSQFWRSWRRYWNWRNWGGKLRRKFRVRRRVGFIRGQQKEEKKEQEQGQEEVEKRQGQKEEKRQRKRNSKEQEEKEETNFFGVIIISKRNFITFGVITRSELDFSRFLRRRHFWKAHEEPGLNGW